MSSEIQHLQKHHIPITITEKWDYGKRSGKISFPGVSLQELCSPGDKHCSVLIYYLFNALGIFKILLHFCYWGKWKCIFATVNFFLSCCVTDQTLSGGFFQNSINFQWSDGSKAQPLNFFSPKWKLMCQGKSAQHDIAIWAGFWEGNGLDLGNAISDSDKELYIFKYLVINSNTVTSVTGSLKYHLQFLFLHQFNKIWFRQKSKMTKMKQNTLCINKTIIKSPSYSLFAYIYLH